MFQVTVTSLLDVTGCDTTRGALLFQDILHDMEELVYCDTASWLLKVE